ncbi:MAG: sugar ABC transporter substrate-binding protein [Chloroflexi bacterium]|nr:sugar ABC transporter substrate-binding protein [Chloroflexota bacterium]
MDRVGEIRRGGWALPLGAALVLVLIAGCFSPAAPEPRGQRSAGRSPRAMSPEQVVTVSWSFWGSAWEKAITRRVVQAFEAEHPSIHVELIHKPWEEYFTWLAEEWAAGRSPDVMFINYVPMRAASGMLANLEPWLARDRVDLADFYPALLDLFRYQGALYGLPRDNDTKVIYYNRRAFDAAGLPYPDSDWTWADLRRLAAALTLRDDRGEVVRYGFGFEPYWWRLWVWQNGGDLFDDPLHPTRSRLDEPAVAEALEFLATLMYEDRSTPPIELLQTDSLNQLFREGRLAMVFGGHGKVPVFADTSDLDWDVVGLPRGKVAANVLGGAGYAMSRISAQPEAAWQLLKFLAGPKGQALFAESGLITPARRSVREDHIFLHRQPYNSQVFLEETTHGQPNLQARRADELNAVLEAALRPFWRGEQSAAEALAAARPAIEDILAEER